MTKDLFGFSAHKEQDDSTKSYDSASYYYQVKIILKKSQYRKTTIFQTTVFPIEVQVSLFLFCFVVFSFVVLPADLPNLNRE